MTSHRQHPRWALWVSLAFVLVLLLANTPTQAAPFSYPFSVDEDALSGAPDASDLNQALGPADRLVVRGRHFMRVGADGLADTADDTRVRLWGVNLSFEANFPAPEEARRIAQRLRRLGFNAVRLHHLDTLLGRPDGEPRGVLTDGPYPSFDEDAVARLAHFIDALAEQGIYSNLNLRVGYVFRPEIDGVPAFDASAMARPIATPILVYSAALRGPQEAFARGLIARLRLRGHPGLAMVEINNESSLLAAWSRREWSDAVPPAYRPELAQRWQDWLTRQYGSVAAACKVWRTCSGEAPAPLLTPADIGATAAGTEGLTDKLTNRLRELSARTFGPGDPVQEAPDGRTQRARDFVRFLADVDREYLDHMADVVREALDADVPIGGTQMAYGGVLNLSSHAGMSYIDEHFYVDHPHMLGGHRDPHNWRIWDVALTQGQMPRLMSLGLMRDRTKPYVVSEFNHPFPSRQGAQIMPLMAAVARLQDWDGLFFFDYANAATNTGAPSHFTLRGDWGKYVIAGQAARLFRSDALAPLQSEAVLPMDTLTQAALAAAPNAQALAQHAQARWGLTPEMGWRARLSADTTGQSRPPASFPEPVEPAPLRLDTSGLATLRTRDALGLFGQSAASRLGEDNGLRADIAGRGPYRIAALLTALDAKPVESSTHLLLTLGSHTVGTQPGSRAPRPKAWVPHPSGSNSWTLEPDPDHAERPSGARQATGPAWLEARPMRLSWPASQAVTVYPLDGAGRRQAPLPAADVLLANGRLQIAVSTSPAAATPWYEIVAAPSSLPAP